MVSIDCKTKAKDVMNPRKYRINCEQITKKKKSKFLPKQVQKNMIFRLRLEKGESSRKQT